MTEEWRGLIYGGEDYSEWIEGSNLGRVKNPKIGTIRRLNILKTGYYFVSFSMGSRSKKKTFRVHKGLAETFIPNPESKPLVNHIDGDKLNNNLDNLEWVTYQENSIHAYETGLMNIRAGFDHTSSILTPDEVKYIRENYLPRDREFGARAIARRFNISHSTVLDVVNNIRYVV